jgi:membrane-bound lytic murein transglycosylase D
MKSGDTIKKADDAGKGKARAKSAKGKGIQTRAPGPARTPNEAVRRAVTGAAAAADAEPRAGVESPELLSLREADRELFPEPSPPVGLPWSGDWGAPLVVDPSRPSVRASGLPKASSLGESTANEAGRDLGWLSALMLPELPVRWDARVVRYLEYYRDDPRGKNLIQAWLKKSGRYGATMRKALREQGLPEDLLWVALVESGFEPAIRSPAGAAGLWQLMPEGARVYGLVVDRWIDERLDPERSTEAAARYLSDLHRRFGAWELALAAYNMGYGGLLSAIRKYNTNDYWELSRSESGIPYETALYVPKIIAMAVVAKNFSTFGLDPMRIDAPLTFDQVTVPSGVTIRAIAAAARVEPAIIEGLNPQLRAGRTPPEAAPGASTTWIVRVPLGKGPAVSQAIPQLGAQDQHLERYTTRLGDSVESVAASRGATKAKVLELNALRTDEIVRPGTVLLLPPVDPSKPLPLPAKSDEKPVVVIPADAPQMAGQKRVFYRVMTGDTLPEIAAAFRVAPDDLRRWNVLDPAARLHEGMTLQVYPPERTDLAKVVCLAESEVHCLTVGSDEFYAHFEGLRGRKRTTVVVEEGDTWERIGKRFNLTLGQLERINQRSHFDKLVPKETLVVYAPATQSVLHATAAFNDPGPLPLAPAVAPNPEDLPKLPEAPATMNPAISGRNEATPPEEPPTAVP